MKQSERVEVGPECPRCYANNRAERSFCRRCGKHLKPKAMKRAPSFEKFDRTKQRAAKSYRPKRSKPPPQMSARRQSQQERRAEVVREVHLRDRCCQAGAVHALTGIPCEGPLDPHEIIPRSAWAKGYLVASNVVLCCRQSHQWIDNHPHGAHALGLHGWSWERTQ